MPVLLLLPSCFLLPMYFTLVSILVWSPFSSVGCFQKNVVIIYFTLRGFPVFETESQFYWRSLDRTISESAGFIMPGMGTRFTNYLRSYYSFLPFMPLGNLFLVVFSSFATTSKTVFESTYASGHTGNCNMSPRMSFMTNS